MDGTPQLLTDVKFSTHRKGYDPDEVDNFLERVSAAVAQLQDKLRQATERAEAADAQVAEARRLQTEAEERGGGLNADEEMKKVLVLAQRAADQAVDEANTSATRTLADARAKAVNLLAEAEQERDRMLAKARKKADAAAEDRARELHEQVTSLEAAKVELQSDVDALTTYLDRERSRLRSQLDSMGRAVDDPRGLALGTRPEVHDTNVPDLSLLDDFELEPEVVAEEPVPTRAWDYDGIDDSSTADPAAEPEVVAPGEAPAADLARDDEPVVSEATASGPVSDESDTDTDEPDVDLTSERLFGDSSDVDPGPPTQRFDPVTDSPLGEPDAAADAAMRAFFERDLDEDEATKGSRFGRRR